MTANTNRVLISWAAIHQCCRTIADKARGSRPEVIIAVSRGGLVPAGILAQMLSIKYVETVCVESRSEQGEPRPPLLLKKPGGPAIAPYYSNCLVIDDIADSGATFRLLRDRMPQALFAACFAKGPGLGFCHSIGAPAPEGWLVFPWEEHAPEASCLTV